jgi:hypothetical protein
VSELEVLLAPEFGGKVTGLRLGPAGRQWLAPPLRPLRAPAPGQDWGALDCSGWDECLPNIGASPDGRLADHGDVWRLPWQPGSGSGSGSGTLSGSVTPPQREYRFARDITTRGPEVRVEYRLENLGTRSLPWAWAQHLLLAADERTRIVASAPIRLRLDSAYQAGTASESIDWLCPDGTPRAELGLEQAAGRAAKLWFEPPLPAVVAVLNGPEWLAWQLPDPRDAEGFPDLGLWVNLGGWGDPAQRQVAVEPAFGSRDAPDEAYPGLEPLPPGEQRRWRTVIRAGVGVPALNRLLDAGHTTVISN